jgi:polysaccharide deacetylase 2 family uncharacterized protein YibQ
MMQGEKTLKRFFDTLKTRPVLFSLFLASTLYFALFITTLIWLALHSENTVQRRIAQSPSVTVIIKKPAVETSADKTDAENPDTVIDTPPTDAPPASWNKDTPAAEPEQTTTPDTTTDTSTNTPTEPTTDKSADTQTVPATETPQQEETSVKAHWQNLARDFNRDDPRPRIAIIVTDLGVIQSISQQAINQLPADVTLSFQAIAPNIDKWLEQSHKAGHENLLAIPMEPKRYPQNDPGPNTLLTMLSPEDNATRLQKSLRHKTHAIGVMPAQGEAFIANNKALTPVLSTIKQEGLIFVDATQQKNSTAPSLSRLARLPFLSAPHIIDATQSSRKDMLAKFARIEQEATQNGSALIAILPYPIAIEQTKKWLESFPEKNLLLAPVSALISTSPAEKVETTTP